MDPLKENQSAKRELIIEPFDDVVSELLTNEDTFNQISRQLNKFESVVAELGRRVVTLENENSRLNKVILNLELENTKTQKVIVSLVSMNVLIDQLKLKVENIENASKDKKDVKTPIKLPEPIVISTSPSQMKLPTPSTESNEELVHTSTMPVIEHPITFTHKLNPIFHDQRSINSTGVAILKEDVWEVNIKVEILESPPPDTLGYINYLNNQVPLGFNPKELVRINTDRNGLYVEQDKVIFGYISYVPEVTSTYPHFVTIQMLLK